MASSGNVLSTAAEYILYDPLTISVYLDGDSFTVFDPDYTIIILSVVWTNVR